MHRMSSNNILFRIYLVLNNFIKIQIMTIFRYLKCEIPGGDGIPTREVLISAILSKYIIQLKLLICSYVESQKKEQSLPIFVYPLQHFHKFCECTHRWFQLQWNENYSINYYKFQIDIFISFYDNFEWWKTIITCSRIQKFIYIVTTSNYFSN